MMTSWKRCVFGFGLGLGAGAPIVRLATLFITYVLSLYVPDIYFDPIARYIFYPIVLGTSYFYPIVMDTSYFTWVLFLSGFLPSMDPALSYVIYLLGSVVVYTIFGLFVWLARKRPYVELGLWAGASLALVSLEMYSSSSPAFWAGHIVMIAILAAVFLVVLRPWRKEDSKHFVGK